MLRRLLPILATLTCGLATGTAAEPVVATPYTVRHDVQELLDDLAHRRGERGALLDRVQAALAEHGELLLLKNGVAQPIGEALGDTLRQSGLNDEFISTFAPIAERKWQELGATRASSTELRRLARGYPGTATARLAWRTLADREWDAGHLAAFASLARLAADQDDPQRAARFATVGALLGQDAGNRVPTKLEGLEELWRIDLGEPMVAPTTATTRRARIRRTSESTTTQPVLLTSGRAELSAVSDGLRLAVIDHVVGRIVGDIHQLGDRVMNDGQNRPVVLHDGFAALGVMGEQVQAVAIDGLGRERWRHALPGFERTQISAPVRIDDLLAFAVMMSTRDGADLRVIALDGRTGTEIWNVLVARLPGSRLMAMGDQFGSAPAVVATGDGLVICANDGLLARVGADGTVRRVWSYPSMRDELTNVIPSRSINRAGALCSDGTWVVATPADSPGTTLVLGPNDSTPRAYTGDNSGGEVLAVHHGLAVLAGRRLTLVELASLHARWTVPCEGDGPLDGCLDSERLLVSGRGRLRLIDSTTGRTLNERSQDDKAQDLAAADDALLIAQGWTVVGLGHGASFLERLTAAAARDPHDYRPLVALASLYAARDDRDRAWTTLVEALKRGAPSEYAERAALVVRHDLELAAGDAQAFPAAIARLETIVRFDRRLEPEVGWWRGRHDELLGDRNAAVTAYRATLTAADRRITFTGHLEASAHSLAEAGLSRLGERPIPAWCLASGAAAPPTRTTPAWSIPCQSGQRLTVVDDHAIVLTNGVLTARQISDGSEQWWRKPSRPLLGVSWRGPIQLQIQGNVPDQQPPVIGLQIDVMPGSAAAAAGMRSGDRLVAFNGNPTVDFDRDLRLVVAGLAPRSSFTAEVERGNQRLALSGMLGGDLVEPVAGNHGTVLVWPLAYLPGTNRILTPEGMWFAALDANDGHERWRWSMPPITSERTPIAPLMTPNGLVITQDGGDLVGLVANSSVANPSGGTAPEVRWRLPGAVNGLAGLRVLTDRLLWLPMSTQHQIGLVDSEDGTVRFLIPATADAQAVVSDGQLALRSDDGRIALWDLTVARQRWSGESCVALVGFCGDGILVLDDANRLALLDRANGNRRRSVGNWTRIETWNIAQDSVLIHARSEGRQSFASVGIPGAAVRWDVSLPMRAEVKSLLNAGPMAACILADGPDREGLLVCDQVGSVISAMRLDPGQTVAELHADGGVLLSGGNQLRSVPPGLPTPPAPLPCPSVEMNRDLATTANAALPQLVWQQLGSARYAIARVRSSLLIFTDLPPNSQPIDILPSDATPLIEGAGAGISFRPNGPVFTAVVGGWRFAGTANLAAPNGMLRRDCVRLDPPPELLPTMPVSVRASCGTITDAADAPWWLHRGWRLLSR